ncbi:FecR family protein [Chitinophaga japonensis]|uniref:FecR family protein n=1 Tax=Chitinophaga japonensis TaxID=104662 RepID=A0A562SZH7_CHIJA|nr:FecR domain-containing protein [Chitinophaga japonensis]TWI86705.1 FecR family protein [Chitinophaga japonensis]
MSTQPTKALLEKYVAGKCTPGERLLVEAWYRQEQERRSSQALPELQHTEQAIWEKIQHTVRQPAKRVPVSRYTALKVAACLLLLLGAGYLLQRLWPATPRWLEVAAQGRPLQLQLDDGSVIWLNAGGRLRYPARFSGRSRLVELLGGEACLDVRQDPAHPFLVKCGGTRTRVLGTVFNIRTYEGPGMLQVTVQEGKVAVSCDGGLEKLAGREMVLQPGERLTLYTRQQQWHKERADAAAMNGWTAGRLLFSNERLDLIAWQLEQRYRVRISFADTTLAGYRITAGFAAADPLEEVLDALSLANNLHYAIQDDSVIFSKPSP